MDDGADGIIGTMMVTIVVEATILLTISVIVIVLLLRMVELIAVRLIGHTVNLTMEIVVPTTVQVIIV